MFCRKCGAEIIEGTKFCSKCGTVLSVENATPQEKEKPGFSIKNLFSGKRKVYIIVSCAIVAVLAVSVFLFINFILPGIELNTFKSLVQNRDYRSAYMTYDAFDSEKRTKANNWMRDYISSVEADYYEGKLDYATVTDVLDELIQFDAAAEDANKAIDNIALDNQSSIVFEKAKGYVQEKKWKEAYTELQKINVKFRLYDEVAALRTECVTNVRTASIKQMEAFAANKEIDKLIAERDLALMVLPDDKEIIQAAQTKLDEFVTKTLADADVFAEQKDFESAQELLREANAMYEHQDFQSARDGYAFAASEAHCEALVAQNDLLGAVKYAKELADADPVYRIILEKYVGSLVQNTLTAAKDYADKRQFEKAIEVIEQVQTIYDCEELQNAVEDYTGCLPIRLIDCYEVQTNGTRIEEGDWTDSLGNEHKESLRFEVRNVNSDKNDHVIYNINGKYVTLAGTLAYGAGKPSASTKIKFYVDDKVVYTSPSLVKTSQPVSFSVDVSGGKLLRVEAMGEELYEDGRCIIDASLS